MEKWILISYQNAFQVEKPLRVTCSYFKKVSVNKSQNYHCIKIPLLPLSVVFFLVTALFAFHLQHI